MTADAYAVTPDAHDRRAAKKAAKQEKREQQEAEREYFAQAAGWDADLFGAIKRSERLAWYAAAGASCIAVCAIAAVTYLVSPASPLTRVEPYVVRVEEATGIVDVVEHINDRRLDYGEAIAKYFLARYVRAREGYQFGRVDADYSEVLQLSSDLEARQYGAFVMPRNPDSPLNRYGERGSVDIKIRSIAFIRPSVATVRYLRLERRGGTAATRSDWVATIQFDYSKTNLSAREREVNPLGFTVTQYRLAPEVINNAADVVVDSTMPAEGGL